MSSDASQPEVRPREHSLQPSPDDPTIGRLVADASRDISALVRGEIALAKSELKVSVKNGGIGAGLFAAAAFLLLLAVIMFSMALAYFFTMTGMHPAWAFLLVFLLYVAAAAGLGYVGYTKVRQVGPPERAIHQAQEASAIFKGK